MPYTPRKSYTEGELREALILDLEADLEYSLKNDPPTPEWATYQDKIRADLKNLRDGGEDDRL